jgi:hypothetical protein
LAKIPRSKLKGPSSLTCCLDAILHPPTFSFRQMSLFLQLFLIVNGGLSPNNRLTSSPIVLSHFLLALLVQPPSLPLYNLSFYVSVRGRWCCISVSLKERSRGAFFWSNWTKKFDISKVVCFGINGENFPLKNVTESD